MGDIILKPLAASIVTNPTVQIIAVFKTDTSDQAESEKKWINASRYTPDSLTCKSFLL